MNKKIIVISILTWLILIFVFSNQNYFETINFSTSVLTNFFYGLALFFKINVSKVVINAKVVSLLYYFRKFAHMFEYFILEILVLYLFKITNKLNNKTYILSIIICVLYAITDEVHQLFVSGRTSSLLDVFIDFIGIFIGSILYYKLSYKRVDTPLQNKAE